MPYIRLSISQKLDDEKQKELVNGIGAVLNIIPGKDESGLIVDMEDGKTLYVAGEKQENMVFADVRYYSNFPYQVRRDFTVAALDVICKILGTSKEKTFLTITEYNSWGGFGSYLDEYYSE